MTHEFKKLIQTYLRANIIGLRSVMATVVALKGSSYRRPGVRMLITSDGQMTGAVSGGCVEKEILKQSATVFKTGIAKMMTYDGRYRLGCEGLLYILIEPFDPEKEMMVFFEKNLEERQAFEITSYFSKIVKSSENFGSVISFVNKKLFAFKKKAENDLEINTELEKFSQKMMPCFKLIIIGAEHDAVQLTKFASLLGWEVSVISSPSDPQNLGDFPGAHELLAIAPESLNLKDIISKRTGVVLMTHSYVRDLQFLNALKDTSPIYLGLLGPAKRRERLLNEFIESNDTVKEEFFDRIYGPTGLNIGAETPEEISLSICSEILSVIRGQKPKSLKDKTGKIHLDISL
jgi:xanthine/CO dehydrogenase XdhC/CoxF family maturation factor